MKKTTKPKSFRSIGSSALPQLPKLTKAEHVLLLRTGYKVVDSIWRRERDDLKRRLLRFEAVSELNIAILMQTLKKNCQEQERKRNV